MLNAETSHHGGVAWTGVSLIETVNNSIDEGGLRE
jgi:hypothetical protein